MAIKELQSIIQNSGNQQTGGSDISMEEFARRNRESAESAIDEYEKWKRDKLIGSGNAQQNLRNRYYDASGMDYFRRDFNDYVSAGAGMSDSDKIWEQNIKNQRDYFSRYAKYFSDDELRQFNGELDYYESIVRQRMENGGANEDQEYPEYITIAGYQSKLPAALVSGNRGEAFDISQYSEDVIAEHSGTILDKQNQLADSAKSRMDAAEKNVNDVDQVINAFLKNSDISFDEKGNIVFKNSNDRAQYSRLISQRESYVKEYYQAQTDYNYSAEVFNGTRDIYMRKYDAARSIEEIEAEIAAAEKGEIELTPKEKQALMVEKRFAEGKNARRIAENALEYVDGNGLADVPKIESVMTSSQTRMEEIDKRIEEIDLDIKNQDFLIDYTLKADVLTDADKLYIEEQNQIKAKLQREKDALLKERETVEEENKNATEVYSYIWGSTFLQMQKDENFADKVAEGKERYDAEYKAFEEELNNMPGYVTYVGLAPQDDKMAVGAVFVDMARENHPIAVELDKLTQEEKDNYYYLVAIGQDEMALQYAKQIALNDRREKLNDISDWAGTNTGTRALATFGSILLLPFAFSDIENYRTYESWNGIGGYTGIGATGDALRGGAAQGLTEKGIFNTGWGAGTIDEKVPIVGGIGLGDGYQLLMSMVDSFVSAQLLGTGATILLGSKAASSAFNDAINKGASYEQAVEQGLAQGVAEALFEYISIDKLLNGDITAGMVKRVIQQAGVEASEEILTSIANSITDRAIMKDKSEFEITKREYMEQGLSENEAEDMATRKMWEGIAFDGIGGLLSGGGMSLMYSGTISKQKDFQDYMGKWADAALQFDPSSDIYQEGFKMKALLKSGEKISEEYMQGVYERIGKDGFSQVSERVNTEEAVEQAEGRIGDVDQTFFNPETAVTDVYDTIDAYKEVANTAIQEKNASQLLVTTANALKMLDAAQTNLESAVEQGLIDQNAYSDMRQIVEDARSRAQEILDLYMNQSRSAGTAGLSTEMQPAQEQQEADSVGMQAYLDAGASEAEAISAGEILDGILRGEITSETISNSQIGKLLANEEYGRNAISAALGVEVSREATASKQRSAVKAAIAQYEASAVQRKNTAAGAMRQENITPEGVTANETEGKQSVRGDEGRQDVMDPGEQAGIVGESGSQRAADGEGTANLTEAERKSLRKRKLNRQIERFDEVTAYKNASEVFGSEKYEGDIAEIPEEYYTEGMKETAEKLAKDGVRVRYFKGTLMSETHDGRMRRTPGLFRAGTNEVWASVSSARFTPEQIAMHEYYHALVNMGKANVEKTVQEIKGKFSPEEFDRLVEQYLKDYRGAYEGDETEDIYEELLADAYAGMNRFAQEKSAVQYQDVVRDQTQRGTNENERAMRDTRGAPESRFSFGRGIKLGRQEYRNLQSARMTKYTTYGKMMLEIDGIFANDMFYIIKNHELDSFDAIKKIDPAKDNEIIEEIMEGIDDGSQNENEVYSKVVEVLQSEQRDSVRGRGNNAKRRSGRQDAGLVHGTDNGTDGGGNLEESASNRNRDGRIDKLSFDDEDYMLAVEAGDMDAAQEMVDEAAKAAGYAVRAYHGTESGGFNEFTQADDGYSYWFTDRENVAESYAGGENGIYKVCLDLGKSLYVDAEFSKWNQIVFNGQTMRTRDIVDYAHKNGYDSVHFENVIDIGKNGSKKSEITAEYEEDEIEIEAESEEDAISQVISYYEEQFIQGSEEVGRLKFQESADELVAFDETDEPGESIITDMRFTAEKIDGNVFSVRAEVTERVGQSPATVYAVFDGKRVKSADPVTYDDNGNVIPLSERFNSENADIRYSFEEDVEALDEEYRQVMDSEPMPHRTAGDLKWEIRDTIERGSSQEQATEPTATVTRTVPAGEFYPEGATVTHTYGRGKPFYSKTTNLSPKEALSYLQAATGMKWRIEPMRKGLWKAVMTGEKLDTVYAPAGYNKAVKELRAADKNAQVPTVKEFAEQKLSEGWRDPNAPTAATVHAEGIKKSDFTASKALNKIGVKIDGSVTDYSITQNMRSAEEARRRIVREIYKAEKYWDATKAEKQVAVDIANGDLSYFDIPDSCRFDVVSELAALRMDERMAGNNLVQQRRYAIRDSLLEKAMDMFPNAEKIAQDPKLFNPSALLVMNYRTAQRNMMKIFGDELGAELYEYYFAPVTRNEASRQRWMNEQFDKVRKFEGSDGKTKKLTRAESAYVHEMLDLEGYVQKVNESEKKDDIIKAAQELKEVELVKVEYDSVERAMMGVSEDNEEFVERQKNVLDLAVKYNLDKEQTSWMIKYAQWIAMQEGYSGKVDEERCKAAAAVYRQLFDDYFEAINDFLVAHGANPIGKIEGYTPHITANDKVNLLSNALEQLGFNANATRLPAEIAGRTEEFRPNRRWTPFFEHRTGERTDYDIVKGFESYVTYISDVLFHMDDIQKIRSAEEYLRQGVSGTFETSIQEAIDMSRSGNTEDRIDYLKDLGRIRDAEYDDFSKEEINEAFDTLIKEMIGERQENTRYSDMVVWLQNYANVLAGKQFGGDRGTEHMGGRNFLTFGNKINAVFARANVAGNLSSALNQMAQLPTLMSERRATSIAHALGEFTTGKLREFAMESDFLTAKKGVNYITRTVGEMTLEGIFKPTEFMDSMLSTLVVRSAYLDAVKDGMSHEEAMRYADNYGQKIMADRSKGAKPLAFHSKGAVKQMLNMFQIEALNSWEHISQDLPRDFRQIAQDGGKAKAARALALTLLKYLIAAFVLNRWTEEEYGGTPAPFDLFGMTANFIASGNGLTTNEWIKRTINKVTGVDIFEESNYEAFDEFDWGAAAEDTVYNLTNEIPFVSNISGMLGLGDRTLPTALPGIVDAVTGIYDAASENGVFSDDTALALVELLKSTIPGGRQIGKTVGGIRAAIEGGKMNGTGENERLQYVTDDSVLGIIKQVLFGVNATEESRAHYASGENGLTARQTQMWKEITEQGGDGTELFELIQGHRRIGNDDTLTSAERSEQQRNAIAGCSFTDEQKAYIYSVLFGDKDGTAQDEPFGELMDAGMSWDAITEMFNEYKRIYNDDSIGASEQTTEFQYWIDKQKYTKKQREIINDSFRYGRYSSVDPNESNYSKLVAQGVSPEDAKRIVENTTASDGEGVKQQDKVDAILKQNMSDDKTYAALGAVLNENVYDALTEARAAGISCRVFMEFREKAGNMKADKDTNDPEKTIAGSKKEKVVELIDSLQLTTEQKDVLYLMYYSESGLYDTPWH